MIKQEAKKLTEQKGINTMLAKMMIQTCEDYLSKDKIAIEDVEGRNGNGLFSFSMLCQHFELEPEEVREKLKGLSLKKWKKLEAEFNGVGVGLRMGRENGEKVGSESGR